MVECTCDVECTTVDKGQRELNLQNTQASQPGLYSGKQQRQLLSNKLEEKNQYLRLSSDFHPQPQSYIHIYIKWSSANICSVKQAYQ